MADFLCHPPNQSIRRDSGGVLQAAQGLIDSAWSLYGELETALPEFVKSLETSLQILRQSLGDGVKCLKVESDMSKASRQMLEQLPPIICDIGRHTFTMATSDASRESFLLPDSTLALQVKTRLRDLNRVAKGLSAELSTNDKRRANTRLSHVDTEEVKNFWEMIFDDREEIELAEFYEKISAIIGREPRCPLERLGSFFTCDYVDPLNFDRFVKIVDANNVQTAHDKLLMGSAINVSQFLKSQIRIGHLRDAIPQGDSNEPIRALDARRRTSSNDSLTSPHLGLSPKNENGNESITSVLSNHSDVSSSAWLKIKVENWFREVDRLYRFFHGDIPKDDAEALLRGRLPGTFLLRYSCTNPSRLCVSFVYSVDSSPWKEEVHRRDVIVHHELICTNVKGIISPRQGGDIRRRFSGDDLSPRREKKAVLNSQKAFSALHHVMKSGALLEESLKSPGSFLPGLQR
ncbi:uncharacterized protein LOC129267149 [Lytechinus pictus]|uniref:uncharacterized protein LOC129267149 n=1 Tax=Lytechinus pictus TaxID=7653 RepID=UPI0030BA1A6B